MKNKITHLDTGRIGELLGKAKFIEYGFDVYSSEVDNKGIDFVVFNKNREYFEIQVKTTSKNWVFMKENTFNPKNKNLYLLLVIKDDEFYHFNLIPSSDWIKEEKSNFLQYKKYENKKSKPEYGIPVNNKHIKQIIEKYSFEKMIGKLF